MQVKTQPETTTLLSVSEEELEEILTPSQEKTVEVPSSMVTVSEGEAGSTEHSTFLAERANFSIRERANSPFCLTSFKAPDLEDPLKVIRKKEKLILKITINIEIKTSTSIKVNPKYFFLISDICFYMVVMEILLTGTIRTDPILTPIDINFDRRCLAV